MRYENHTWVICAYGESAYVEACIQSLKNQTLASKIILYTSTPNDLLKNLCDTYQIPFYTKEGGGIGKDWNNALSFVDTRYATIAHQDDYYEPSYLEKLASQLEKYPNSLIAYSDYFEEKNGQRIPKTSNLKIKRLMLHTMNLFPSWRFWRDRVLGMGNPICCPAVTYNLELLKDFTFSQELRVSLDWYAWYQISKYKGRFTFINKDLMCHRIHEESETSKTIADQTRTKEDLYMYELFWPKAIATFINRFYEKSQNTNI